MRPGPIHSGQISPKEMWCDSLLELCVLIHRLYSNLILLITTEIDSVIIGTVALRVDPVASLRPVC